MFAVISLGVLITVSVILRVFFNSGVPDAIVIVRELMVAAIVLPLASVTSARAHIAVEFVSNRFPVRLQNILLVGGSVFALFSLLPLLYAGWNEAVHTINSGGFFFGELQLPKWPGRIIFLLGITFCWLRLIQLLVQDIATMRSGRAILTAAATTQFETSDNDGKAS